MSTAPAPLPPGAELLGTDRALRSADERRAVERMRRVARPRVRRPRTLPDRQRALPHDSVRAHAALRLHSPGAAPRPHRPGDERPEGRRPARRARAAARAAGRGARRRAARRSTRSCRSPSRPSGCSRRRPRTSASSSSRRTSRARRCCRSTASPPTPRRSSSWSTRPSSTPSSAAPPTSISRSRDHEVVIKYRIDGVLYQAMEPIDKRHHQTIISRIKVMSELDIAEKRDPPGRPLQAAPQGPHHRLPRLDHALGARRGLRHPHPRQGVDDGGVPQPAPRHPRLRRRHHAQGAQVDPRALRHGAGHRADRQRQDDDPLRLPVGDPVAEDKIITIEDPVEYQLKGITQIPVNEKKGLTFARGLRSILRHDPDKIMVGEIRDEETAQIAIQSALTGHLVFTTVHANNVVDVLGRFLNMKVDLYNFVSALNCVLAQRLVRRICPHCRRRGGGQRAAARGFGAFAGGLRRSPVLRRCRLSRVQRHRLPRPPRGLGAARPLGSYPRADSGEAAGLGDQARGQGRGNAVPARVRAGEGSARSDDAT